MHNPLPTSTAAAERIDAHGILDFLDAVETDPEVEMHSLMVLRHGRVVTAGWWSPYTAERAHLLYSLSKSFTSAALGFAVAEGLVGLDDPVVDHFPEFQSDITDPRSRAIRVRHAASMATGHTDDMWFKAVETDGAEPVRGFLLLPPERDPGTVFAYNQPATYSVAAIVQRASGQRLRDYLRPRLLDPLGIGQVGWQQHPAGRDLGFTGLHATTDAIARLGQLYLSRGAWDGRALLSPEWVAEATRPHVENPHEPQPDWRRGYGFQFWMSRHGYRGDGAFGQFCLVLPEQDMVIATTASTLAMQSVLDAVWTHVVPAVDRASAAPADDELAARMAGLSLSPSVGAGAPPADADAWDGTVFAPARGRCADQPSLVAVELGRDGDGEGWDVTLVEDASEWATSGWTPSAADGASSTGAARLRRSVGVGRWSVVPASGSPAPSPEDPDPVPTAVSGGWDDARTLCCHLLFLETPHRLVLTCDLPSRTFHAQWEPLPPLRGGRLATLRSPVPG